MSGKTSAVVGLSRIGERRVTNYASELLAKQNQSASIQRQLAAAWTPRAPDPLHQIICGISYVTFGAVIDVCIKAFRWAERTRNKQSFGSKVRARAIRIPFCANISNETRKRGLPLRKQSALCREREHNYKVTVRLETFAFSSLRKLVELIRLTCYNINWSRAYELVRFMTTIFRSNALTMT